jgi:putative transposase
MPEIVHTLNRGVDKRKIFLDNQDRFRFIHDLYEFNDEEPVNNMFYLFSKSNDIASRYIRPRRKLLVDILAFSIMPNHYHLLLMPRAENAVPLFMKKLNIGYAKYFNEKYERTGTLFEGRYKAIPVEREAHFIHLPYYIHCNPLDLEVPEWRERALKNPAAAMRFLKSYRWSSHLDYLGKKNFPSVTAREFLLEFFGGTGGYRQRIARWLKDISLEDIKDIALE